jgi:hypothetical protein
MIIDYKSKHNKKNPLKKYKIIKFILIVILKNKIAMSSDILV